MKIIVLAKIWGARGLRTCCQFDVAVDLVGVEWSIQDRAWGENSVMFNRLITKSTFYPTRDRELRLDTPT